MATIDERSYWTTEDRRLAEDLKTDAEIARLPETRLHILSVRYSATPDTDHAARAAIAAEIEALSATIAAAKAEAPPVWTLEETKANRAEWNAQTRKGRNPAQILNATGLTLSTLKSMIEYYGL